ncbi:hypothetical protein CHLNCDRAFT_145549 [Chlorella variabilis]|uniref:CHRD domain-containing protein n=1 Tax=Chlorella variabilis TaxID=554065 RepID=E1ZDQ9_CHLVA|nr:hypothetical protein CHLNCDRAFT_145549 [Chlorella variabilis]EFN56066.1 hypothetical protein CHLNCDRAFT_145549 [Chlorella variabilis]|eukprot:XP_005848168.1 hypothetical protein CHLNCDRAFT_145549 [Chlorella variabilis]
MAAQVYDANRATMAHIHQGGPNDNGPVIVFLVPVGVGSAATTQTLPQLEPPQSGDVTFRGSFTAADIGGPAAGMSLSELINLFRANQAYVNVHDEQNPAGVVRGQVEWV